MMTDRLAMMVLTLRDKCRITVIGVSCALLLGLWKGSLRSGITGFFISIFMAWLVTRLAYLKRSSREQWNLVIQGRMTPREKFFVIAYAVLIATAAGAYMQSPIFAMVILIPAVGAAALCCLFVRLHRTERGLPAQHTHPGDSERSG